MKTNVKINQSGRSMVEMLGVLAIIGVLSVAGVAGFKVAMTKHHANEILNGTSMRAMVVIAQIQKGKEANQITLAEFSGETVNGSEFDFKAADGSSAYNSAYPQFAITVSDVSAGVCKQMVNTIGSDAAGRKIIKVGSETALTASDCEDSMDVGVVYNVDMTSGANAMVNDPNVKCSIDTDCTGACEECSGGYCRFKCAADQECAADGKTCQACTTIVIDGSCCPSDRVKTGYNEKVIGCCSEGEVALMGQSGSNDLCCKEGEKVALSYNNGNYEGMVCCPAGASYKINGVCCPSDRVAVLPQNLANNPSGAPYTCCPTGKVVKGTGIGTSMCCDSDETAYGNYQQGICCEEGKTANADYTACV